MPCEACNIRPNQTRPLTRASGWTGHRVGNEPGRERLEHLPEGITVLRQALKRLHQRAWWGAHGDSQMVAQMEEAFISLTLALDELREARAELKRLKKGEQSEQTSEGLHREHL